MMAAIWKLPSTTFGANRTLAKAIDYLNKVCRSDRVAEIEIENAHQLLKEAKTKMSGTKRRL
jgi:hypothetical protein